MPGEARFSHIAECVTICQSAGFSTDNSAACGLTIHRDYSRTSCHVRPPGSILSAEQRSSQHSYRRRLPLRLKQRINSTIVIFKTATDGARDDTRPNIIGHRQTHSLPRRERKRWQFDRQFQRINGRHVYMSSIAQRRL